MPGHWLFNNHGMKKGDGIPAELVGWNGTAIPPPCPGLEVVAMRPRAKWK